MFTYLHQSVCNTVMRQWDEQMQCVVNCMSTPSKPLSHKRGWQRWPHMETLEESEIRWWEYGVKNLSLCYLDFIMQVAATLCACLTATSWGVNYGITSAVIFEFQKDKDDHVKMSLEDASWMRKKRITSFEWWKSGYKIQFQQHYLPLQLFRVIYLEGA